MASILLKRAYERPSPNDGIRILVDRLWPRGLKKDAAALDYWEKELAPTPSLRKWFGHRPERFKEFTLRYRIELRDNPAVPEVLGRIGSKTATLVFAARDPLVNHAVVLADYLSALKRNKSAGPK
jgi:uncharacterized protein YeaO (DUF488 family)